MSDTIATCTVIAAAVTLGFTLVAAQQPLPPAEPQAVYQYVTKINNFEKWPHWPGKEGIYASQSKVHGAWLETYVNEPALAAIKARAEALPEGAIVVKENFTAEKQLSSVTLMYRSAAAGNQSPFFWMQYAPDGTIKASGQVDGCIACHRKARGTDFVFSPGLADR